MKVKFLPDNIELDIAPNQSVMDLAHQHGISIKSVCNGMPSCAECRVRIIEGEHNVFPPSPKELSLIGTGHFIDQRRLSCQLQCFGDVVVDLEEQKAKAHTQSLKRPQGSLKKDESEQTHAVTGNLIEQEDTLMEEVEQQSEKSQSSRPKKRSRRRRGRR